MGQDAVTDKFAMDVVGGLVIRKSEIVRRLVGLPAKVFWSTLPAAFRTCALRNIRTAQPSPSEPGLAKPPSSVATWRDICYAPIVLKASFLRT